MNPCNMTTAELIARLCSLLRTIARLQDYMDDPAVYDRGEGLLEELTRYYAEWRRRQLHQEGGRRRTIKIL